MSEIISTKSCPHCKGSIDKTAKKCQHCQTDLRSWVARHPVLSVLIVIILIPFFIAASKDTNKSRNSTGNQINSEINSSTAKALSSLTIVSSKITNNVIGTPELHVTVKNISDKTVDAFKVAVDLYNNFDQPISEFNSNRNKSFVGISQDVIKPGANNQSVFNLAVFDQATKLKNPRIIQVHFTDGTSAELTDY